MSKNLRGLILIAAFALPSLARAQSGTPTDSGIVSDQVVRITRGTPVFSLPSAKAKVLADVDVGTVLILQRESPRGLWIMVRDEDGNEGWVPTNRTDYRKAPAVAKAKPDNKPAARGPRKTKTPQELIEEVDPNGDNEHAEWERAREAAFKHKLVEVGLRKAFSDPNGDWAATFKFTYFGWGAQEKAYGLTIGYFPYFGGLRGGFSVPLRIRLRAQSPDGTLAFGPDVGVLFMKYPEGFGKSVGMSIGLGLSAQRVYRNGLLYGVRVGFDFLQKSRFGLELDLGWNF